MQAHDLTPAYVRGYQLRLPLRRSTTQRFSGGNNPFERKSRKSFFPEARRRTVPSNISVQNLPEVKMFVAKALDLSYTPA